tara:strand:- start:217 stop:405 length:189 start_codon:yes stop_codon:yes gene_type:complete
MVRRGDKVMTFMHEAEKFVKAVSKGVIVGCASQVPFSDQAGGISLIVESFCDGLFIRGESGP